MACCGDYVSFNEPTNDKQPGDVLALMLWRGNHVEHGKVTRRAYPRGSYPQRAWVNREDVLADPRNWLEVVETPPAPVIQSGKVAVAPPSQAYTSPLLRKIESRQAEAPATSEVVAQVTDSLKKAGLVREAPPPPITQAAPLPFPAIPNTRKIVRLLGGNTGDPVFVAPRRDYDSYSDFWTLVNLSGFEMIRQDQADLDDPSQTYIFTGPEGIPDCREAKARTIFWQLEYYGDYAHQPNRQTVDQIWSSDPRHAIETGARFVLLGSHPSLNPEMASYGEKHYDVTQLAYLTPRRQEIKDGLPDLLWTPDYPGHSGEERHKMLMNTRLMLHVHQHGEPYTSPLRYALAAAYRLPVVAEKVVNKGVYAGAILWAEYGALPTSARMMVQDSHQGEGIYSEYAQRLYELLVLDNPFYRGVESALKDA